MRERHVAMKKVLEEIYRGMRRRRDEAKLMRLCVKELRAKHPDVITYRHAAGDQMVQQHHYRLRKLEGETTGAGDLFILKRNALGECGLMVEFKVRNNTLSPAQRDVRERATRAGYRYAVVTSLSQFKDVLNTYNHPEMLLEIDESDNSCATKGYGVVIDLTI